MLVVKTHYLGLSAHNLKHAHPVNYFSRFWAKYQKLPNPVNYSFLPPWDNACVHLACAYNNMTVSAPYFHSLMYSL